MNANNNLSKILNENIDLKEVYLINENQYQQKSILDDKVIFKLLILSLIKL